MTQNQLRKSLIIFVAMPNAVGVAIIVGMIIWVTLLAYSSYQKLMVVRKASQREEQTPKGIAIKLEQLNVIMLSTKQFDEIFQSTTLSSESQFERIKQELESLIADEKSGEISPLNPDSIYIQDLEQTITEVNQILASIHRETGDDSRAMKIKADGLYMIAHRLQYVAERHQEFYSKDLLNSLRHHVRQFEALGKQYEIRYVGEFNNEKSQNRNISLDDISKFFNLLTEFVVKFASTHSNEVTELAKYAVRLTEPISSELPLDDWLAMAKIHRQRFLHRMSSGSTPISEEEYVNFRLARIKFIDCAINAQKSIELERNFMRLATQWRRQTYTSSAIDELEMNPAYQEIIAMGEPVIPLLLRELERKPAQWFMALGKITGENPVPLEFRGRTQEMIKAWLRWGREKGLRW